jgi:hypothetical protein
MVHHLRILLVLGEQREMTRLAFLVPTWLMASLAIACSGSSDEASPSSADPSEATPDLTPTGPPGDADQPFEDAAPGAIVSPECDRCLSNRCSGEVEACSADADCASLLACVTECSNQSDSCFGGCLLAVDAPPEELFSLLECLSTQCEMECGSRVTPG